MNINHRLYLHDLKNSCTQDIPWEKLSEKTVLVTGASGLIGSAVIDILMYRNRYHNQKTTVIAMGRNPARLAARFASYQDTPWFHMAVQDVTTPFTLQDRVDFAIHAASNADPRTYSTDPVGTMTGNFLGMLQVLNYVNQNHGARVLYVSSGEVYGEGTGIESFKEGYSGYVDCTSPRACYPSSKRAAETLCASYYKQYGLETVIARPCHVYGPTATKQDSRASAQFFNNVLRGEDIVLKSQGLQLRTYCYGTDCASAILCILLKGKAGEAYNVADKNSLVTIRRFAELTAEASGKHVVFDLPDKIEREGYTVVTKAVLDASKLEDLGWQAQTPIAEGIKKTIEILKEEQ